MKVDILNEGIVVSRPEQMYAWPGITKTENGDILVSASERKFHVDPYGREVIIRSEDNGNTWNLPQEVYNSELDDRDANLLTLSDGRLVLSWFTSNAFEIAQPWVGMWPERCGRITDKMREELLGTWMVISSDNGHTWDKHVKSLPVGMHVSPIELSDGSLISIGIENRFSKRDESSLQVYKSDDLGDYWYKTTDIPCLHKDCNGDIVADLNENHILETSPGNLIALFRSERGDCREGYLYQSSSSDYGCTWTHPEKTDIWGFPPHILKLSNGVILCMYGYRRTPFSIKGVLSYDNGKSWDTKNIFSIYEWDDKDEIDIGYPVSVEITPEEILTVFYCSANGMPGKDGIKKNQNSSHDGLLYVRYRLKV